MHTIMPKCVLPNFDFALMPKLASMDLQLGGIWYVSKNLKSYFLKQNEIYQVLNLTYNIKEYYVYNS